MGPSSIGHESKLAIQYAGVVEYLNVELGMMRFHYFASQRMYTWLSTPVSGLISLLSCIVAASESLSNKDSTQKDNSLTSLTVKKNVSMSLAIISIVYISIRPYSQHESASEAIRKITRLGERFDKLRPGNTEENLGELENIKQELISVRLKHSGVFLSLAFGISNLYLMCFPNQLLHTRWNPTGSQMFAV